MEVFEHAESSRWHHVNADNFKIML